MKTKSVQKCSTRQSFIFPKWHSFKIGTLRQELMEWVTFKSQSRLKLMAGWPANVFCQNSWPCNLLLIVRAKKNPLWFGTISTNIVLEESVLYVRIFSSSYNYTKKQYWNIWKSRVFYLFTAEIVKFAAFGLALNFCANMFWFDFGVYFMVLLKVFFSTEVKPFFIEHDIGKFEKFNTVRKQILWTFKFFKKSERI